MNKTIVSALLTLAIASMATSASAASLSQCKSWSADSDQKMGGCRASYLNGEMTKQRSAQCCGYRLKTISTWKQCTAHFGPVGWGSLNESKREWGCR